MSQRSFSFKKFLWKIIFVLFVLVGIYTGYKGVIMTNDHTYAIIQSHFRQKKILKPNSHIFIPEACIPKVVQIDYLSEIKNFHDHVQFTLPYAEILKSFGSFDLNISYSFEYKMTEALLESLDTTNFGSYFSNLAEEKKALVNEMLDQVIQQKKPLSKEIFIKSIMNQIQGSAVNNIHITFETMPDFALYNQLMQHVQEYSLKSTNKEKVFNALRAVEENELLQIKKNKLNEYVNTVINIAKKIKDSGANESTTLTLLQYFLSEDKKK